MPLSRACRTSRQTFASTLEKANVDDDNLPAMFQGNNAVVRRVHTVASACTHTASPAATPVFVTVPPAYLAGPAGPHHTRKLDTILEQRSAQVFEELAEDTILNMRGYYMFMTTVTAPSCYRTPCLQCRCCKKSVTKPEG